MPAAEDSTLPDFWNTRYAAGKTPWDLRGVPAALRSFLARAKPPGHVLIPGCGSGYEVQAFRDAGFEVTAIDFSSAAVERAGRLLGPLGHCVIEGDFFTHDFTGQNFDLIYERTFLCSLPPERWPAYATRMARLLRKGKLLAGIFLYGEEPEPEPPPYPLTEAQALESSAENSSWPEASPFPIRSRCSRGWNAGRSGGENSYRRCSHGAMSPCRSALSLNAPTERGGYSASIAFRRNEFSSTARTPVLEIT